MDQEIQQVLASNVSRLIVSEIAPHELPIFPSLSQASLETAGKPRKPRARDEQLGFGIELQLLTPVVLSAVTAVGTFLIREVLDASKEAAAGLVLAKLLKLFKRDSEANSLPVAEEVPEEGPLALTKEQAQRAHEVAFERGALMGLSEEKAMLLADAIVGRLVIT
ncbi:MAG: hypothetical protein WD627_01810 [Actinomycetota bacterium]